MKLLLVDDDPHIRRIVSHYLRDFDVTEAANGDEAVSVAQQERFDVAVVDLILPQSSGTRVCRELRETGRAARIVAMSGDDSAAETIGDCADAFLPKPFTREELLAVISSSADRRRSADTATTPAGSRSASAARSRPPRRAR